MVYKQVANEGLRELALFAGAGGGILGGYLLGWRTVCAVELDEYARGVLGARQNDGTLPPFPVWDDVRTFDGRPWRGVVDVVSGGFPCQDISAAGKGAGITGSRSGLWSEMARIVGEVRPQFVLVENSPLLVSRGLAVVLGDLASLGYDARWGIVGAHHAGAPHRRDRIWILGHATEQRLSDRRGSPLGRCSQDAEPKRPCSGYELAHAVSYGRIEGRPQSAWRKGRSSLVERGSDVADANGHSVQGFQPGGFDTQGRPISRERQAGSRRDGAGWWQAEPRLGRVANGVANRVDRLRAIGNGQVPAVVRLAWDTLSKKENL